MLTARERFQLAAKSQREKLEKQARRKRAEAKRKRVNDKKRKGPISIPLGYLSLGQIVSRYNRSPSCIYKAIRDGMLKSEKLGPYRIIEIREIERYFIEAKERQKSAAYRAMFDRVGRN
jgi:hypothetical protein